MQKSMHVTLVVLYWYCFYVVIALANIKHVLFVELLQTQHLFASIIVFLNKWLHFQAPSKLTS